MKQVLERSSRGSQSADEPGTERLDTPGGPPAPRLLVVASDGTWTSRLLPERGVITFGRGQDVDVSIDEASVSRRQARLEVTAAGYLLTDLGSANGTRVGNTLLRSGTAALEPGQPVMMGRTVVMLQPGPPPTFAPPAPEIARGPRMRAVDDLVAKVAPTMMNVIIWGETGVGKDLLAERIHKLSARAAGPLLRLNSAGLSPQLLESELFGHERGAFTGATSAKQGLLEVAAGGTVLLDEVAEMPLEIQAKLLLAIEQRVVRRVGGTSHYPIDVRFLSATHRDLEAEIRRERFRLDFFYRLNGITIRIPPLRERREELEGLIKSFAHEASHRLGRHVVPGVSADALRRMLDHDWPGNIRELRNVVERAVLLCEQDCITPETLMNADLRLSADLAGSGPPPAAADKGDEPLGERERVRAALAECGGNQSRAARLLGVSRNTLMERMRRYGLARPRASKS